MIEKDNHLAPAAQSKSVRKAVEAIAINPKSGRITFITRKLFNVLLFLAQKQGEDTLTYRMALGDILIDADFASNDTALIKEHLRKMIQIQVEWNSASQDGSRRWGVTNLLAEVEIIEDKSTRRTWIEWSYSPKIKKRLLDPSVYARISLQFQSSLRSSAALALHEICSRYAESPNNLTMRHHWKWWRPVLTGVPDDEDSENYPEYKYFKRNVIKGAMAEVNTMTDLEVELVEHKDGRRIEQVQFRVRKKAQAGLPLTEPALFDMGLVGKMMSLGLTQREVERVYGETEENVIRAALAAVETRQRNKSQPPLESPGAWFKTALKSGLTKMPALPSKPAKKARVTQEKLKERYFAHQIGEARALFSDMNQADQTDLLTRFQAHLPSTRNAVLVREFEKKGIESKIAESSFFAWMAEDAWGTPSEKDLLEFVLEHGDGS